MYLKMEFIKKIYSETRISKKGYIFNWDNF